METNDCWEWAREQFGGLELGDARRTARVVEMARVAAGRPGGHVLDVFRTSAARQGAYDLLENPAVESAAMVDGIGLATAAISQVHSYVLVSVDGSSLNIVDRTKTKGFGIIGNVSQNGRGLKVVTSLAIQPDGTPLGVLDQQWWKPCGEQNQQQMATTHDGAEGNSILQPSVRAVCAAPPRACSSHARLVSPR